MGNLFNSEIVGLPTDATWGFKFPLCAEDRAIEALADVPARHPAQLYEALCYLVIFAIVMYLYFGKDMGRRRPGVLISIALIGIFTMRFFIEFLKERQVDFEEGMSLDMGQLLSIPFIVIGIIILVIALRRPEVKDLGAVVSHANKMYDKEDKKNGKRSK
jgi:prolipoprotein diacylglyceryltransferase